MRAQPKPSPREERHGPTTPAPAFRGPSSQPVRRGHLHPGPRLLLIVVLRVLAQRLEEGGRRRAQTPGHLHFDLVIDRLEKAALRAGNAQGLRRGAAALARLARRAVADRLDRGPSPWRSPAVRGSPPTLSMFRDVERQARGRVDASSSLGDECSRESTKIRVRNWKRSGPAKRASGVAQGVGG